MNKIEAKAGLLQFIINDQSTAFRLFQDPIRIIEKETELGTSVIILTDDVGEGGGFFREILITYDNEDDEVLHVRLGFGEGLRKIYESEDDRQLFIKRVEDCGFKVDTLTPLSYSYRWTI
jgi:hypothetical protein